VGWWTESNGDDLELLDGTVISTIKGDIIRVDEWYGWNGVPNEGCRMVSDKIAAGIKEREIKNGWRDRVTAGAADSSIYNKDDGTSIGERMAAAPNRIKFVKANKSKGSRKNGWELMRIAIANATPDDDHQREYAGLFVTRKCEQFLRTVPTIPRDVKDLDDVDTASEDHIADESRYHVLSCGKRFTQGKATVPH